MSRCDMTEIGELGNGGPKGGRAQGNPIHHKFRTILSKKLIRATPPVRCYVIELSKYCAMCIAPVGYDKK